MKPIRNRPSFPLAASLALRIASSSCDSAAAASSRKAKPAAVSVGFASVPLEEADADLLLKSAYLKAQGWLAEMNQLGSASEVQSLCYGEKRPNLTKFHLAILFAELITDNKTINVTNHMSQICNGVCKRNGMIPQQRED
jgi:hypothetical protein